jgi:hypothetical protein
MNDIKDTAGLCLTRLYGPSVLKANTFSVFKLLTTERRYRLLTAAAGTSAHARVMQTQTSSLDCPRVRHVRHLSSRFELETPEAGPHLVRGAHRSVGATEGYGAIRGLIDGLVAGNHAAAAIDQDGTAGAVRAQGVGERRTPAIGATVGIARIRGEIDESEGSRRRSFR